MARPSIVPPNLNGHVYSCTQEVGFIGQKCQFSFYYRSDTPNLVAEVPNDEKVLLALEKALVSGQADWRKGWQDKGQVKRGKRS